MLWLIVVSFCLTYGETRVTYNGSQVLQVHGFPKTYKDELLQLQNEGVLELWNMNVTSLDLFVRKHNLGFVKNKLTKDKLRFKVVVDNLQELIDKETYILSKSSSFKQGGFFTFNYYHRMADIYIYLENLAQSYPQFVQLQDIGFSVEGRPLKVVKISSGVNNAKSVWIDGGIHAREWISVASVIYIISELVENRYAHAAYTRGIDYYILPIFNPDGYEYSHTVDRLWRKNRGVSSTCVGTDLNRNWGFHWGGPDVSRIYCSETYPGTVAFSEPETRVVANFILSHAANLKAYISFHSYGQYILYPWGYDRTYPSDYTDLDRAGREMAASIASLEGSIYTVGSSATTLYPASGGSDDWVKGIANVKYAYVIELRDTGQYGFLLPPNYIRSTGAEALAAVKTISLNV